MNISVFFFFCSCILCFQVLYCYSHCMWSLFSLFFLTYCALIKSLDNLMLVIFSSINLFLLLIYTHSILVHLISNNWNHVFFSHCNKRGHFQVCWQDKKYIIRDILLLINKFVTLTVPSICNLAWTQHWENPKSIPGADLGGCTTPSPLDDMWLLKFVYLTSQLRHPLVVHALLKTNPGSAPVHQMSTYSYCQTANISQG